LNAPEKSKRVQLKKVAQLHPTKAKVLKFTKNRSFIQQAEILYFIMNLKILIGEKDLPK
jgi:hypothetical protein